MNYIILDLEATCWSERKSGNVSEIIEIGAVKVNDKNEVISEFNEFIKPKLNPELSDFCKQLTSINQDDIDNADFFESVIQRFQNWINIDEDFFLCSWGFYDKNQLIHDCKLNKIKTNWLNNHISLKHQYTSIKGTKKHVGMGTALKIEKMNLDGFHHRGIDDAKNITKIFQKYFNKWIYN